MSSAVAAAELSGNSENFYTLSVLQEINLLRESQLLIDIHVEVSEIFVACSIFVVGIARENIWGPQGDPGIPIQTSTVASNPTLGSES